MKTYLVNFEFPISRMGEALTALTQNPKDWEAYPTLASADEGLFLYATVDWQDGNGIQVRGVCKSSASPRAWQGFCNQFSQDCVATQSEGYSMGFTPARMDNPDDLVKKYGVPNAGDFVTFDKAAAYISGRIKL